MERALHTSRWLKKSMTLKLNPKLIVYFPRRKRESWLWLAWCNGVDDRWSTAYHSLHSRLPFCATINFFSSLKCWVFIQEDRRPRNWLRNKNSPFQFDIDPSLVSMFHLFPVSYCLLRVKIQNSTNVTCWSRVTSCQVISCPNVQK